MPCKHGITNNGCVIEHMAVEEAYVPHRWTNMSMSDNEGPREHKLLNSYYTPPGSETEDKVTGDKYLFPYTGQSAVFTYSLRAAAVAMFTCLTIQIHL